MELTEIPFSLPGKIYRSAMPYGIYDPRGAIYPAYRERQVSTVVVLVEREDIIRHSGRHLLQVYAQDGLRVLHLPSRDFGVPDPVELHRMVDDVLQLVQSGENIAVHCLGGIGRTGLFLACLAKRVFGMDGEQAITWLRGYVPGAVETGEQRRMVNEF